MKKIKRGRKNMNKKKHEKSIDKIMNFGQFFAYKTNNKGIQFYVKLVLNNRLTPYNFQNKVDHIKAEYEIYCRILGIPYEIEFA